MSFFSISIISLYTPSSISAYTVAQAFFHSFVLFNCAVFFSCGLYHKFCLYKKECCFLPFIFVALSTGAGNGSVDVVILDPHGRKDKIRPSIQLVVGKEGTYLVEYIPVDHGLHSVNVFFAGSPIPNSPFGVNVAPRKCSLFCPPTLSFTFRLRHATLIFVLSVCQSVCLSISLELMLVCFCVYTCLLITAVLSVLLSCV
jgi:hypothetical protein